MAFVSLLADLHARKGRRQALTVDFVLRLCAAFGDSLTLTFAEVGGVAIATLLTAVREQLATATTRITELANEKAQIGDEVATQQQLTDYQKRIGAAAATVASALDRCVTAQQTLIGYLRDAASYSSTDLARYSSDVDALCRSARDANTALQTELAQ